MERSSHKSVRRVPIQGHPNARSCDNMCGSFGALLRHGGCDMGFARSWLVAVTLLGVAGAAAAQTTNGTISGHVADAQGFALPGVTVNASSPNLQGVRTVVTSEIGDYVIPLLPPGVYTLSFELSGFEKVTKEGTLAPTQTLPIDASLGVAAVAVTVDVVGRTADILTQTAQVATNFKQ